MSCGLLHIAICFCRFLQNLVESLKSCQKLSKVVKSVQEVLKSSSEMIDLQLERLMPEIETRAAPKFEVICRGRTILQNSTLDPIRTNIKDVGIILIYRDSADKTNSAVQQERLVRQSLICNLQTLLTRCIRVSVCRWRTHTVVCQGAH